MKIITAQKGVTIEYAVSELKKYVCGLSRGKIVPESCYVEKLPETIGEHEILLGTLEELSLDTSDLFDPYIEDIIDIAITNGTGYIAGSNLRSILMGIYKYCTSAGCRFIRPGADGDYVPKADLYNHSFQYRKKADHPFRGECSEGAISYEHMRDTVYWLPKIGMNMYMIEGFVPYTYMHKWYGHVGNTKLRQKGQETDSAMLAEYIDLLEQDIKKTGIQLHTLGHNWMFKKLGMIDGPSHRAMAAFKDEYKKYFAQVNGKRDFMHGSPFFTHFCYSDPEARKILIDTLIEYIEEKPFVDFVHVWLADSINNQCECEECVKMTPSDHYVVLLNELDAELTRRGLENRIVFIMYVDTERPPQVMRLNNPHRFILLSAIGMQYEKGYEVEEFTGEEPPFERNNFHPEPAPLRMKWHRDWQELCDNIPSIIFEYRFYTDMYCDLSQMQVCRETHRDMQSLERVSFQGCMSDQTHRMYLPTALPLIMMGETLFDRNVDYDKVADEYFEGAFGEDGRKCRAYLEKLSDLLCPSNVRVGGKNGVEEAGLGNETARKCWIGNEKVAEKAAQIPALLEEFEHTIDLNIAYAADEARLLSWRYLKYHSKITGLFAEMLRAGAKGDMEEAKNKYLVLEEYLSEHEMEFHNAFDVFLFTRAMRSKVDLPAVKYYE